MRRLFPFDLDRSSTETLTDQLEKGIRSAVCLGTFPPDSVLPPMRQAALDLGVSEIVVRLAYRRLAEDGIVVSRPRIGAVVAPRRSAVWRGHVLLVMTDFDFNPCLAVTAGKIREELTQNGYLFSQVMAIDDKDGRFDCSGLDLALSRPIDFVVLMYSHDFVERRLSDAGIPYYVIDGFIYGEQHPGCVGRIGFSGKWAARDFAADCIRNGKTSVGIVASRFWPDSLSSIVEQACVESGISVSRHEIGAWCAKRRMEEAVHSGESFVRRLLSGRHTKRPDVLFFDDDFRAIGALNAFARSGVRIPEDVGLVCYSTGGFGPFYVKALNKIECDPFVHSEIISQRILRWLLRHEEFPNEKLQCTYVRGRTV